MRKVIETGSMSSQARFDPVMKFSTLLYSFSAAYKEPRFDPFDWIRRGFEHGTTTVLLQSAAWPVLKPPYTLLVVELLESDSISERTDCTFLWKFAENPKRVSRALPQRVPIG